MKNQAPKQHNPHYAKNMVNSKLLNYYLPRKPPDTNLVKMRLNKVCQTFIAANTQKQLWPWNIIINKT